MLQGSTQNKNFLSNFILTQVFRISPRQTFLKCLSWVLQKHCLRIPLLTLAFPALPKAGDDEIWPPNPNIAGVMARRVHRSRSYRRLSLLWDTSFIWVILIKIYIYLNTSLPFSKKEGASSTGLEDPRDSGDLIFFLKSSIHVSITNVSIS